MIGFMYLNRTVIYCLFFLYVLVEMLKLKFWFRYYQMKTKDLYMIVLVKTVYKGNLLVLPVVRKG